jgi:uncharacterized protein YjbJ (UPF0337 family)
MNKIRVQGTFNDVVGNAKRKVGELTGDTRLQVEGMTQQMKGKVENAWGKTKEVVHDAIDNIEVHIDTQVELKSRNSNSDVEHDKKV